MLMLSARQPVLAGVFLGAAAAVSHAGGCRGGRRLTWLTVMNGMLAVFNMLPGAPRCGGTTVTAAAPRWRRRGPDSSSVPGSSASARRNGCCGGSWVACG
jgi:Zn-dependent protease